MTPTEKKARDIYKSFSCVQKGFVMPKIIAKQCALIAVDEILDFILITLEWDKKYNGNVIYWQEVKQEIEKL